MQCRTMLCSSPCCPKHKVETETERSIPACAGQKKRHHEEQDVCQGDPHNSGAPVQTMYSWFWLMRVDPHDGGGANMHL